MVVPNIYETSIWNLLHVTLLEPRILRWCLEFTIFVHSCILGRHGHRTPQDWPVITKGVEGEMKHWVEQWQCGNYSQKEGNYTNPGNPVRGRGKSHHKLFSERVFFILMIFLQDLLLNKSSYAFTSWEEVNFFHFLAIKCMCLDFLLARIPCLIARCNNPDFCYVLQWLTNTHDKVRHGFNVTSRSGVSSPFWWRVTTINVD